MELVISDGNGFVFLGHPVGSIVGGSSEASLLDFGRHHTPNDHFVNHDRSHVSFGILDAIWWARRVDGFGACEYRIFVPILFAIARLVGSCIDWQRRFFECVIWESAKDHSRN